MATVCPFCDRKFSTHQGLSSHYKIHKDLPLSEWLEHGPIRSKQALAHFKAKKEAAAKQICTIVIDDTDTETDTDTEPDSDTEPVLSPEPLRAVKWLNDTVCVDLPWLVKNPGSASTSREKPPGAPPPGYLDPDWIPIMSRLLDEARSKALAQALAQLKSGADSKKPCHSFDLNLPPPNC